MKFKDFFFFETMTPQEFKQLGFWSKIGEDAKKAGLNLKTFKKNRNEIVRPIFEKIKKFADSKGGKIFGSNLTQRRITIPLNINLKNKKNKASEEASRIQNDQKSASELLRLLGYENISSEFKEAKKDNKVVILKNEFANIKNFFDQSYQDKLDKKVKNSESSLEKAKNISGLSPKQLEAKQKDLQEAKSEKEKLVEIKKQVEGFEYLKKILSKRGLESAFSDDKLLMVFSANTIDIATQSTSNRKGKNFQQLNWTSCQNLHVGQFREKVGPSLFAGAFIVYLVQANGIDEKGKILNNDEIAPLARVLVKPFINITNKNQFFYFVDLVYPQSQYPKFRMKVAQILDLIHNSKIEEGKYELGKEHYRDSEDEQDVDEIFKYVHSGDFSDISKKEPKFIQKMMEKHAYLVFKNWDWKNEFPDFKLDELNLSGTDIDELPNFNIEGVKNYNLSNTNIAVFPPFRSNRKKKK